MKDLYKNEAQRTEATYVGKRSSNRIAIGNLMTTCSEQYVVCSGYYMRDMVHSFELSMKDDTNYIAR